MKLAITILALASVVASVPAQSEKRAVAYYAPSAGGGSQLDVAAAPLGEPLNVRMDVFITFHMIDSVCTGDHLRPQLSRGTHGLWFPKLRQCNRLVSLAHFPSHSILTDT
jgi:hypothetical protein